MLLRCSGAAAIHSRLRAVIGSSVSSSSVGLQARARGVVGSLGNRFASAKSAGLNSKVVSVLGSQWGDEGKGKLVDILAEKLVRGE